ncbi:MAG TPA: hypothetical protein VGS28_04030 [Candidatus Saccharimonadales bacterium]|nr:hypothetical protein [Candidatus Saccharimonadales bacterium]
MQTILDSQFRRLVWAHYKLHGRTMPWRAQPTPYNVVVSEIMLQQTQVERVIPKFESFTKRFPTFAALAGAPLDEVLIQWVGLGYNRRANYLHQLSKRVVGSYHGLLPKTVDDLEALPGVGPQTAGAILAYAYNLPAVFIETNIRTVYLHHFFADRSGVDDKEIVPIVERTLDVTQPREWYWALMDYGTSLKKTIGNQNHRSRHYTRQSTFAGSSRQLRGTVVKLLAERPLNRHELAEVIGDERLQSVIDRLVKDGLVEEVGSRVQLKGR